MFAKHSPAHQKAIDKRIERQFSLKQYLIQSNYQQLSDRLFVKDNSPEIIRVTTHKGKTFFRNFLLPADKGSAIDFLSHRLHTPGKIVPNRESGALEKAVATASCFVDKRTGPSA